MSDVRTTTVDLAEDLADAQEQLDKLEEAEEELLADFEQQYGGPEDVPDDEEKRWETLDEKMVEKRSEIHALERAIEDWGGSEFVIQELTYGAVAEIQDAVAEASFEFDAEEGEVEDGVPKSGYGKLETMRRSIVQQPPDAPTTTDAMGNPVPEPANYPSTIGEHLFDAINAFNSMGETDLGNSSLEDRMRE